MYTSYVYEPNRENEPEFTWNGNDSIPIMKEAARIARENGLDAWGKPSGRGAEGRDHFGDWDYGDFANVMDGQNIQTQGSCRDRNGNGKYADGFKKATDSIISQYRAAGAESHLFFQVTVSSKQSNINASPPDESFACALVGWEYPEVERVTLWTAPGHQESADMAERFLQLREKLLDNPPPPTENPPSPPTDPLPIPGRIEAEDYKSGGEGVAYHDTTSGNSGGAYRSDDVDLQPTSDQGGGYNIGWTRQGEWLAFDVEIAQAGYYDITARVASAVAGEKSLHVAVDGIDVTGPLSFSDASGWQSWLDVTVPRVNLPAGRHELRLVLDADSFNVNYLEVMPSDNLPPTVSGDANQDGQLTGDDVYLVIDWIIGRQPMPQVSTPAFTAADADADGSITANDVALMIDWLSGDPDQSPLEPSL
jgi:hypothetical protein